MRVPVIMLGVGATEMLRRGRDEVGVNIASGSAKVSEVQSVYELDCNFLSYRTTSAKTSYPRLI